MAPLNPLEEVNHVHVPPEDEKMGRYKALVALAPYIPGDINPLVSIEDIPWLDESLVKHGYIFLATHLNQSLFATILTFILGLPVKSVTGVVLKGQMGDPKNHFQRFLSTLRLNGEFFWFYFDQKKAYKTYEYVRKQHNFARNFYNKPSTKPIQVKEEANIFVDKWKEEVSTAVSADLNHIDSSTAPKHLLTWKPPLAVSQLDMALVQFMFIWMYWGFPKLLGIKNRAEELKGVIHLWAIHGRMIGIQDEYNICLNPDPKFYDLLTRNFLIESLKRMDETVVTVQSTLMDALWSRIPFITYKALLYIGLEELQGREGERLWEIMSFWDKLSFRILQVWMWIGRQPFVIRLLLDIPSMLWIIYHLRTYVYSEMKR
ncbi:unnamed protein product [Orchesella dallaii]|uniref:ER-bound oxygenase mpaB/mpaB'/Rubber oxygenase catalytic domain-containing protein n=1 Tax=Orchesella dallaii TaxID=48710 RepID=A0ABP1RM42_9HEXA